MSEIRLSEQDLTRMIAEAETRAAYRAVSLFEEALREESDRWEDMPPGIRSDQTVVDMTIAVADRLTRKAQRLREDR